MLMYSHNNGNGSKALAEKLGIRRIKHKGSTFKGAPHKVVLNWGSSNLPEEVMKCRIINNPEAIATASHKTKAFQAMLEGEVSIPDFTADKEEAKGWLKDGNKVVARQKLQGSGGDGIVLIEKEEDFVDAPLYVRYIPKKDEYRVHVFAGDVLDVQQKKRKKDVADDEVNWQIRNHGNGFIFAREGVAPPQDVIDEAVNAVQALGLDFGAVDIVYNEKQSKAYVLEVNTAPGLEGTTLDNYAERIAKEG